MHPAASIVFFTTASGAGYGLLMLLGTLAAFGAVPPDRRLAIGGLGLALGLIVAGLLSSTAHLTHPERAWRAFSQWRSSWLSREGVAATATFIPALAFSAGWIVLGRSNGWIAAAGLLAAFGALLTVVATGMIYASLKPIREWHGVHTAVAYPAFAVMTGAVLLNAVLRMAGHPLVAVSLLAIAATAAGWLLKTATWARNDRLSPQSSRNTATGLEGGRVRPLEWPHTEENYLLKEMGYQIAREHAEKLRLATHVLAFLIPLVLSATTVAASSTAAALAASVAVVAQAIGITVERWLFFAEARHTVMLYYRGD